MGDLKEFSLPVQLFFRGYPWRKIDPTPWTPLKKPLSECKVALISSAAQILPGQPCFDFSNKAGDPTFRCIPSDIDVNTLVDTHPSTHFDHTGLCQDRNVAYPFDRLRELAQSGRIGSVNHRHLSFCGAILAPGRLIRDTAPEAARWLVEDGVDVAILVPI